MNLGSLVQVYSTRRRSRRRTLTVIDKCGFAIGHISHKPKSGTSKKLEVRTANEKVSPVANTLHCIAATAIRDPRICIANLCNLNQTQGKFKILCFIACLTTLVLKLLLESKCINGLPEAVQHFKECVGLLFVL